MDPDAIAALVEVDSWPAALVIIFLIVAVLVVPALLNWLSVYKVRNTLEKTNGGSTVRDALNRIEANQADHGALLATLDTRTTALEEIVTRPTDSK